MLNWTKTPPEDNGEYLFVSYVSCGCCIDYLGYCWIFEDEEQRVSPFSYNFIDSKGVKKTMAFEGVSEQLVPMKDGKLREGYYWAEFDGPKEL